jgi:P-type Ca2+ transporter type 2C
MLGDPPDIGRLQLTIAILAVVLLNALIGFMQKYMAERTAEALQAMVPHRARVVRDGERVEVPVAELVPGDVMVIEAGDAISADSRVIEAHELTVNNMALTGESTPVRRNTEPVAPSVARLEAPNLVWMGTTVACGTGKTVVVETGQESEFGRIYQLTAGTASNSQLRRQIAIMAHRVAAAAFALGVLLFAVRLAAGGSLVETLGSTTVICTDKNLHTRQSRDDCAGSVGRWRYASGDWALDVRPARTARAARALDGVGSRELTWDLPDGL